MSDAECGAICVRKDVMDKFNIIMTDTKLDANELMEHLFNLHTGQGEVKSENQDFIPVGMSFNQGANKNSSMSENDDVTCLGVANIEDKVHLLQKLREQAGTCHLSSHQSGSGMLQNFNTFTGSSGINPPSIVSMANSNQDQTSIFKQKKKKGSKKPKLSPPSGQPILVSDGEDLLKSSMCSLCQATFSRFTDLLTHHKEVHNSDTNHPLRCRACGRTQTSEAGLIYHQVYVCKMVERPHQCHICGLKFQSEEMVLVHKCSGCSRKKYACEFCDHYRTESSSDLEKHMRIHTNDKCYVCKVCGFSTAWKKNLKEHMVKHLGLKPYVCDLCGYSTSDRHNLRSHRMKHYQKGEGCEKCGGVCHCKQVPASGKKKKQQQQQITGDKSNNSLTPPLAAVKDLECPYPQCVYRTKIEYMMSNHMLRHQGMGDLNVPNANTHNTAGTINTVARRPNIGNIVTNSSSVNSSGSTSVNSNNSGNSYQSNMHTNNLDSIKSGGQPHSHNLLAPGNNNPNNTNNNSKGQQYATGVNASSPATSSVSPASIAQSSSSLSTNQTMTLISTSANQMPLEWKNIGQPAPPTVFTPPAHFSPLVHHQQGHIPPQAMSSTAAISSWANPLSPAAVPAGLLTSNRVTGTVTMTAQNMVARPMPVFPNMPN